jgi:aryl-alcohol dehydrogenase-like predicted oxidoreductase
VRYLSVASGKKISKIGVGTWQFGSPEWGYGAQYDGNEAHAIVHRAVDLGVTLFDTAEIYSSGRSEQILGQAIADSRESVFLATKLWPVLPAARMVTERALASAYRLGVSRLDLYQAHWPNPFVPDSAIMRGMRCLQRAGLVGEVGVSSYDVHRWRAAEDALHGTILSNQIDYSLVARSAEQDLLPFAESRGRMIIAHSPLAHGLLSGRYHGTGRPLNRVRATSRLFQPENLELTRRLIETLRAVADAHCATPAQIALAWVIRNPVVAAIPGASSVRQLEENVASAEIDLADDEYQALNAASAQFLPAVTADPRMLRRLRHNAGALKHSMKGAWYLTKTVRSDRRRSRLPAQLRVR